MDVDQQVENESLKDKLKHLEAEKLRLQQQLAKQEEDLQSTRSQISTSGCPKLIRKIYLINWHDKRKNR